MHRYSFRNRGRYLVLGLGVSLFLYYLFLSDSSWYQAQAESGSILLERLMNSGPASHPATLKPSTFDWAKVEYAHPAVRHADLPKPATELPKVQHQHWEETAADAEQRKRRRAEVKSLFRKNWQSYRKYAWKQDALLPISGKGRNQFSGWAATLVDSLDTLWIMGLREEFDEAVAVVAEIDFGRASSGLVNSFETNIRYLGGLMAAYDLSKREPLLAKAIELGNLLYGGFNTPNRMPVDNINFQLAKTGQGLLPESRVVSAAPGTLCLELAHLSQLTGDAKYYEAAHRVMELFHKNQENTRLPGMWPIYVSMKDQDVISGKSFTLGGNADSLYEYLPKMVALLGGGEPMFDSMTRRFIDTAEKHVFFRPMVPGGEDILISGNVNVDAAGNPTLDPESEHLTCFIGGAVALAGRLLGVAEYVQTGERLAEGCMYAYRSFPTGIMPERYNMVPCEPQRATRCPWNEKQWIRGRQLRPEWKEHLPKGFTTAKDPRYLLRPEAVESVFVLYRITGDKKYSDGGWEMFEAVRNGTTTEYANAAVLDVTRIPPDGNLPKEDYMESFWLAETLKYFYLLFSPPDLISLDDYVLNSEAHPFLRPK